MTDKYIELEHPGVLLEEDFLDDLGIKPGTLASSIGVDRTAIKNIIDGNVLLLRGHVIATWSVFQHECRLLVQPAKRLRTANCTT